MRRVVLALATVAFVVWLTAGSNPLYAGAGGKARSAPSAQQGWTNPFYVCEGRACVAIEGCGESQCSNDVDCGGCDPAARAACLGQPGWWWDENTCTCVHPACDDQQRQDCVNHEGTWHEDGCWCEGACNNPSPRLINTISYCTTYCYDCWTSCAETTWWYTYQDYCEDGRPHGQPYDVPYGPQTDCWYEPDFCWYQFSYCY